MGFYLNHKMMDKRDWLEENASRVSETEARRWSWGTKSMLVCLVDNGAFTAAAWAYDPREAEDFLRDSSGRRRVWYRVDPEVAVRDGVIDEALVRRIS